MENEGVIGLLSFLSFGFSVIAAVLAIDTYALLRTGQSGVTWRVLIIASVIFALMQALRMGELLDFAALHNLHLSEVVELVFVIALTYAFYLQRQIFRGKPTRSEPDAHEENTLDAPFDDDELYDDHENEMSAHEWARLNGLPTADFQTSDDEDAVTVAERRAAERRSSERRSAERRNRV